MCVIAGWHLLLAAVPCGLIPGWVKVGDITDVSLTWSMVITESEQRAPNMRCRQSKQRASHILQDWEFALSLFPLSFFLLFLKERVAHIALYLTNDESKMSESLFLLFEHKIDSLFMRVWFALVKRKLDLRTSFLFKKGNRFLIKGKSLLGNLFHTFWLCFYKKQKRVNLSSSIFSLFEKTE